MITIYYSDNRGNGKSVEVSEDIASYYQLQDQDDLDVLNWPFEQIDELLRTVKNNS